MKIAISRKNITEEVERLEAKRRREADKLYYQKQIEALKGEKKQPKQQVNRSVTINLAVPKINTSKLKSNVKKRINKRTALIAGGLATVLLLTVFIPKVIDMFTGDESPQVAGTSQSEKADFTPLLPSENGAKKHVNPSLCTNNSKLICYEDKYLTGALTITQQKLDPGVTIDPSKLVDIAKASFDKTSATDYAPVKTTNGYAVIVSYQDISSQRAIYLTKDMLVFVESEKTYPASIWKDYFNNLK